MATRPQKITDSWAAKIASAITGGMIEAVDPVLQNFDSRISEVEARTDPTELADLQTQVREQATTTFAKYLKKEPKT